MPRITTSDKPLGGRYKIISQLGVGGFGRTFLAEDLHLPGYPRCVIKHLKPQSKNDDTLQMARRCFDVEAQVLYHLGSHDQIPRLLAHFEESQEFYLAQEFIEGEPLTRELGEGKQWSQGRTILLLKDILQVMTFVHQQHVIHRDLKPSNLIRRRRDRKIVVIDFGAVKQVSTPEVDPDTGLTNLTISIGTQGYMPNEQLAGKPRFCSDVYAIGVLAIQLLTGVHPRHLSEDSEGEIDWLSRANGVSPELAAVIDRMVRYDFRERYVDAAEALVALENLPESVTALQPDEELEVAQPDLSEPETAAPISTASNGAIPGLSGSFGQPEIEYSHGRDLITEEPASTAIWVPNESLVHSMQAGMTQAVGRPHFSGVDTSTAAKPSLTELSRRLSHPWAIVALLVAGLTISLTQIMLPQFGDQSIRQTTQNRTDPLSPAAPLDPKQQATALVTTADQLLKDQQYDKALAAYDQAIKLRLDYAEAYAGRCEALNQLKRPEEATVACNDALAYRPDYPEALWSQGNARLLQNSPYEALKIYEQVTELKPDFAPGWVKRGVALQKLGRSAEALVALDQGIKLERNIHEAWITKGQALLNLQRYDAALIAINKALQLQPDDPVALKLKQQARDKRAK